MQHRRTAVHYWIRAAILAGFSFYIVHLIKQDALHYYIAPRMQIYVKLAAIGLYVVAALQVIRGWKEWHHAPAHGPDCHCDHDHLPRTRWGSVMVYSFFLVPLLLGFLTPDALLGSTYASQKGMNYNSAALYQLKNPEGTSVEASNRPAVDTSSSGTDRADDVDRAVPSADDPSDAGLPDVTDLEENANRDDGEPEQAASDPVSTDTTPSGTTDGAGDDPLDAMFPFDIFTESYAVHAKELYQQEVIEVPEEIFIETLTTLDLYMDQFVGKTVKISGFIYREDIMDDTQFAVGRIAMACCSADSLPYGVLTEYPRAAQLSDDTWVEVTGELDITEFNGYTIMKLKATSIEKIPEPDSPYVYPNFEFGL